MLDNLELVLLTIDEAVSNKYGYVSFSFKSVANNRSTTPVSGADNLHCTISFFSNGWFVLYYNCRRSTTATSWSWTRMPSPAEFSWRPAKRPRLVYFYQPSICLLNNCNYFLCVYVCFVTPNPYPCTEPSVSILFTPSIPHRPLFIADETAAWTAVKERKYWVE
jgi:hypothetical protein